MVVIDVTVGQYTVTSIYISITGSRLLSTPVPYKSGTSLEYGNKRSRTQMSTGVLSRPEVLREIVEDTVTGGPEAQGREVVPLPFGQEGESPVV